VGHTLSKNNKARFAKTHQRGSHAYYIHDDGRVVTLPMHGKDVPIGTLQNIIVHQMKISVEEFQAL